MTRYIYTAFSLIILFSTAGCIKEVDENMLTGEKRIVISALITNNEGPYFVRVSKSSNNLEYFTDPEGRIDGFIRKLAYEPVTNAVITLSDDQGNTEQLKPYDKWYPNAAVAETWEELGFYSTSGELHGEPGRTYTLTVEHDGNEYKAVVTMPNVPPTIDEINFIDKVLVEGVNPRKVPTVSFNELQGSKDYYMFFYKTDLKEEEAIDNNLWTMVYPDLITFDDRFLKEKVKDLNLDSGLKYGQDLEELMPDKDVLIEMHTLTKPIFNYIEALKMQLRNDGGAYSPAPATPPSSFNNGALGLFRASAVYKVSVPYPSE